MNRKANVSKELHEKHRKILESLLKLPENRECAECKSKGPRWASVNLGIFICMQCSGIHRSLGVHISKVRSATLDTWLPEQIAFVQSMGNERSNSYWEGELPPNYNRVGIQNFIHAKYVQKKWVSRDGIGKSPSRGSREKASSRQATISSVPKQVNVPNHAPHERKIIPLPTTNGTTATTKSCPPPTPIIVPQQVTPEVKPTKPILASEPAPTKGELKKKQESVNPVVPAKVDYATELFNLLCMDDSRGYDSNPSANDDGWVHFQSSEAPSTAGRNDSPAMFGPNLANPNNDMINAFEKSIIASPFSTHQQVATVTPQQSFPMTSAAKPTGGYQAFPANTHRLGSNGVHMATQNSVSGGYLVPGMTMPISEPQRYQQRYIQAGSSQQGYTVNRPMSSMYNNNRSGTTAPSINGMINMKAAVPPPAFPVSSSPQPTGYYDLSFLTQGMLSKR